MDNNDNNEISLNEIKQTVSKIISYTPIEYIHFLGGEPLTRKDIFEIFDFLESLKIKFGFNTNSLVFRD